jgi:hypothetical protein
MEQFERRCDAIDQRLQSTSGELQALTQHLPNVVEHAAVVSMQSLPGQVLSEVRHGLSQPVADYQQRLDKAGSDVGKVSQSLAMQIKRMDVLQRLLIWKVLGATATCLVLLLGGGIWLAMHYTRVIQENQIAADLMRTYNGADVVLCEKDRLCANIDIKGKRYGDRRQYFQVMAR